MAEIELRKETFSMVKLDIFDRIKIKSVIEEFCVLKKISLKDLAKELNISRAQLYNIFDSRLIDLQTLITLQKKFNFSILKPAEVERYLSMLEFDLLKTHQKEVLTDDLDCSSRKSYKSEWLQNFRFLKVNSYYAFLYLRFIGDFLWFDDRKYVKENFINLPFWQKKYLRNIESIYNIPEYENARNLLTKDLKLKRSLDEEEIKYLKELQDSLDNDKNMTIQVLNKNNNFDEYIGRKISEFIESALVSQNSSENNFEVSLNFEKGEFKIESHKEFLNIPIAGSIEKWMRYDAFVKNIIRKRKLTKQIKNNHEKYHKNFIKEVFELIGNDIKNSKIIDKKLPKNISDRRIRYINLLPSELNYYSKDKNINQLLIDRSSSKPDYLNIEARLLLEIRIKLYENNWGMDEDFIGSTLGNKVYYCDLIACERKNDSKDDEEEKTIQITLKIFQKKNTLQISTLERILKTLDKEGWDKHIIFSNLPFSEKCNEFVRGTKISLLLDNELDKFMDIISN